MIWQLVHGIFIQTGHIREWSTRWHCAGPMNKARYYDSWYLGLMKLGVRYFLNDFGVAAGGTRK